MRGEFYKMEFRAWNMGTVDLSLEQEAAYLRLCHAMYDTGGPIPNSTRLLQSLFRCGNVKAATLVRQLVEAGKIQVTDNGKLTNRRVSEELANRDRVSSERRVAGERGGSASGVTRSKSLKIQEPDEAIASTLRSRGEEIRGDTPIVPKGTELDGFDEFKSVYPKRNVAFPTTLARKRWLEAQKRGSPAAEIIVGAKAYAAEQTRIGKVGTEFVKTADAWLHQQRWKDYGTDPTTAARPPAAVPDETWRERVRSWRARGGHWPWRPSEPPDDPRTQVPPHVLAEFDIRHDRMEAAE